MSSKMSKERDSDQSLLSDKYLLFDLHALNVILFQTLKDESSLLSLEAGKLGVPTWDLTSPSGGYSAISSLKDYVAEKRELSDLVKCFV